MLAIDWGEVTAIATCVLAVGLLGGFGAAVFAAQQVREARKSREATIAAEFFRRWNEESLVEARRLARRFKSSEELTEAFREYVTTDAEEAYVLYRELDFFEQLAALESIGAFDFELIKAMVGRNVIARWELWKPAVEAVHGPGVYPMFEQLADKLRAELGTPATPRPQ